MEIGPNLPEDTCSGAKLERRGDFASRVILYLPRIQVISVEQLVFDAIMKGLIEAHCRSLPMAIKMRLVVAPT
jgi:hypothetical protein